MNNLKQFLLLLIVFFTFNSLAATITARTDRMNISVNDAFTLTLSVEGNINNEPDFSPLKKDFDILGQSQGSNITIINGDYKKSMNYNLTLMPKRAGNLVIPAISFGKDSSQPVSISVTDASAATVQDANLILDIKPSRTSTYVQSQIILTVKLMSAVNIRQYGIDKIDLAKFDAVLEPLGEAKQYQTTQNDRNFLVIEQKYALYPQQTGTLTINPVLAQAEAVVQSRSFYDPFNLRSETLRARSNPVTITIQDIPAEFHGKNWLPASDIQLLESWSPNPPEFKVGEPVTRTLDLFADGLTAAQIPQLASDEIDGIKQYPDQAVLNNDKRDNTIIGERREKIAYIPTRTGTFTLPAIEISWLNTKTGKTEIARLESRTILVAPGNASVNNNIQSSNQPQTTDTEQMADMRLSSVNELVPLENKPLFNWLTLVLGLGWLITAVAWWFSAYRAKSSSQPSTQRTSNKIDLSDIKKACANHDAHACRQALIHWGRQQYSKSINNLDELGKYLPEETQTHLNLLNHSLYSSAARPWLGTDLWNAIKNIRTQPIKNAQNNSSLEPLYK